MIETRRERLQKTVKPKYKEIAKQKATVKHLFGEKFNDTFKVWMPERFTWLRQYQHQTTVLYKDSAFSGKIFLREATNVYQGTNTTNQEPFKNNPIKQ